MTPKLKQYINKLNKYGNLLKKKLDQNLEKKILEKIIYYNNQIIDYTKNNQIGGMNNLDSKHKSTDPEVFSLNSNVSGTLKLGQSLIELQVNSYKIKKIVEKLKEQIKDSEKDKDLIQKKLATQSLIAAKLANEKLKQKK